MRLIFNMDDVVHIIILVIPDAPRPLPLKVGS